ncbi:ATP-binding response regulator [Vibrio sp. WJH972]
MENIKKVYQYAEPNLTLVGWMGFIGFPVYYIIWAFIFPQPYENIGFRLLCSGLFFGLIYRNHFPMKWRDHLPILYQITIIICLPSFFFYMLLMNEWNTVWLMSFMTAIFIHILLVNVTLIMFAQTFIGVTLAIGLAWLNQDYAIEFRMDWSHIPVFLFIYLFGNLFCVRNQVEHEAKVSIAKSFGAGIAHEMRIPLSSLSSSINVIQSVLPNLKDNNTNQCLISRKDVELLREVSTDALKVIHSGNETIDLLLTSIDENRVSRSTFKHYSAQTTVESAIEDFSYQSPIDRDAISIDVNTEFMFFGSGSLLKYVMFNLIKNAFYHRSSEGFHINIVLTHGNDKNQIVVTDNGVGISNDAIQNIFQDFYTTGKSGNYGLGLPFCQKVMRSFGGNISCRSEVGEWTQFTLTMPLIKSEAVKSIKYELTKLKTLLYIGDNDEIIANINRTAASLGFKPVVYNPASALAQRTFEFNHDLIVVDTQNAGPLVDQLDAIGSSARFVYLYDQVPLDQPHKASFQQTWIEMHKWLEESESIIDHLLFVEYPIDLECPSCREVNQKHRTIMLVDDNDSIRKFTAIMLEKQGFDVIQKENGKRALEALEHKAVDLIIMDIEMPIMDGIKTSRTIRASHKAFAQIPIIAHSGDNSPDTLKDISSSGISDFIVKPVDKNTLLNKISNWV